MAPPTGFKQSLDPRGSRDGVLSSLASPKGLYSTAASPQERLMGGGLVGIISQLTDCGKVIKENFVIL